LFEGVGEKWGGGRKKGCEEPSAEPLPQGQANVATPTPP
jgi:hypothetical protein